MRIFAVMVKISRYRIKVIRFRQWSRKAFAVFSSLGKVVAITRVGKTITEVSLAKVEKYRKTGRVNVFREMKAKSETPPDGIVNHIASEPTYNECMLAATQNCCCRMSFCACSKQNLNIFPDLFWKVIIKYMCVQPDRKWRDDMSFMSDCTLFL